MISLSSEESPGNFSLSDNVRAFIQQAFDNKIDLTVESNRKDMMKQFKEAYPKANESTVRVLFSKEIPKIAKAYNINPDDVKREPAKKFTKDNEINVKSTEKKSGVKTVGIQNPTIIGKDGKPAIGGIGQVTTYKYEIKSSQLSAFSNSIWGFAQIFCEDLEDFTESESKDIGDLTQPFLQAKIGNSDRGQGALMVGGLLGITARKAKKAKQNRKIRKEKEVKERGTNLEPSMDEKK